MTRIMKIKPLFWLLLLVTAAVFAKEPDMLQVECGNVEIFLAPQFFWNLNGIKRNGVMIGRQDRGFYGTVIRYDVGWVGTGHLENKIGETNLKVKFFCDGKEFIPAGKKISGKKFVMEKTSVLHNAQLRYTLILEDDLLTETAELHFLKDEKLSVAYNFMHPWESSFEHFRTLSSKGKIDSGIMPDAENGKMLTFSEPLTASFYSEKLSTALVSTVKTEHASPANSWLFWNRGSNDRKLYFRPLHQYQVKAGEKMQWTMRTHFRTVSLEAWQKLDLGELK